MKFLVYGGKSLPVALTVCDTQEAADLYRERGDAWYGPGHPIGSLSVAPIEVEDGVGEQGYLVMLQARYGGYQTIFHSVVATADRAADIAREIGTPAFSGKYDTIKMNLRPFPVMPRTDDGNMTDEQMDALFSTLVDD